MREMNIEEQKRPMEIFICPWWHRKQCFLPSKLEFPEVHLTLNPHFPPVWTAVFLYMWHGKTKNPLKDN